MADLIDFVVEFLGASSTAVVDSFANPDALALDLGPYQQKQKQLNVARKLTRRNRGVAEHVTWEPSAVQPLVDEIVKAKNAKQLGTVCLSGYSKGSWFALGMGLRLTKADVAIRYIGVSDFPIINYGFNPPIAEFGEMIPITDPQVDPTRFGVPPRALFPPFVKPPKEVKAKELVNYFQHDGNGMKPVLNRPPSRDGKIGWWWSSNMVSRGEVHGSLDGWDNRRLPNQPFDASDDNYHDRGDADGRKRMAADIVAALTAGLS